MFLFDLGNDRLWSWYPPCKSSLSIQWTRWRWGGRELTWNKCILKGADPVVQVMAFHEDSVVVFKPSAVLLSVFVCDCLEFNSFGCTLFKANWSVSCQLWLLNTMFIHSFILAIEGSIGMVVNYIHYIAMLSQNMMLLISLILAVCRTCVKYELCNRPGSP